MEMIATAFEAATLLLCVLMSVGVFVGTVAIGLGCCALICWKIYTYALFVLGR